MNVYIWVVVQPSKDYGQRTSGARLIVVANNEAEARRLMDEILPHGMTVSELAFRGTMHTAQPQVFEATGFVQLDMNDGYKTQSYIHGKRLGLT